MKQSPNRQEKPREIKSLYNEKGQRINVTELYIGNEPKLISITNMEYDDQDRLIKKTVNKGSWEDVEEWKFANFKNNYIEEYMRNGKPETKRYMTKKY